MSGAFVHAGKGSERMDASSAYEAWVNPHMLELEKYCSYLAGSKWDAEDLLQDTLLKAFVYFVKVEPEANMKAFVFRIARNLWIDECRKRRRKRTALLEMPEPVYTDSDYAEIRGSLEWLAERFSQRSIEMWLLARYFGYTLQEVADTMDVTVPTVKSVLFRTRAMLRQRRELQACQSPPIRQEVERWSRAVLLDLPCCLLGDRG